MGTRAARKAATRRRLLDAAHACLTEQPFDQVGIADIAARAGIAAGTVYVHFESKDALVDAVIAEVNAELRRELAQAWRTSEATRLSALHQDVARAYLGVWRRRAALMDAYADAFRRQASPDLLRDGTHTAAPAALREGLAQVARLLGLSHDPSLLAHTLNGTWRTLAMHAILLPPEHDEASAALLAEITDAVLRRLLHGIEQLDPVVVREAFATLFLEAPD